MDMKPLLDALQVLGAIATFAGVVAGVWKSFANGRVAKDTNIKVAELKVEIDGRIEQLLRETARSNEAIGRLTGRDEARANAARELATRNEVDTARVLAIHGEQEPPLVRVQQPLEVKVLDGRDAG